MIQEAIYFWMSLATLVFTVIGMVFISIYRKYERENFVNGINFVLMGMLIIIVVAFINMIRFASVSYSITLNSLLPGISTFVPIFITIKDLMLYPAMAVMFLVSAIVFRK